MARTLTSRSRALVRGTARTVVPGPVSRPVRRMAGRAELWRAVRNHVVAISDAGAPAAQAIAERLSGAGAIVVAADEPEAVVDLALREHGRVDVLVLGTGRIGAEGGDEPFTAALEAIEHSYFPLVRAVLTALPSMARRRRGHLVVVTTAADPHSPADRGAAAAVDGFLRCIASEIVGREVHVSRVHLPADPQRAARRVAFTLVHRP